MSNELHTDHKTMMQDIWSQIEKWMQANAPQVLDTLQPGASDAQIAELENLLSIQFPEDVRASYRIHNGQSTYRYGLINGREFLSLERIRDEWQVWKELLDSGEFQIHDPTQESNPDPGIRHVWWSDKWIPLTHDGAGNHDCLDLNPADGGKVGQIITMWHDDDERKLIALSFRDWLKQYAEGLASGQFVYSEEYGSVVDVNDL